MGTKKDEKIQDWMHKTLKRPRENRDLEAQTKFSCEDNIPPSSPTQSGYSILLVCCVLRLEEYVNGLSPTSCIHGTYRNLQPCPHYYLLQPLRPKLNEFLTECHS